MIDRRSVVTLLAASGFSPPAFAQTWPTRPIRIIVPFPAGQATDILARLMADQLGKVSGQQVIAENRPGAGGQIGADAAAKAAPDGYTLLMVTISSHGISPALYPRLPYDPQKDFAPIANIALTPQILMTSLKSGIDSVSDLVAKAKALGVADERRSPFLPDVPTVAEQGIFGIVALGWIGLSAPASTPEPILDRLSAEVMRIFREPAVLERMTSLSFVPAGESRREFEAYIAVENTKWRKIIQDVGVKIE